MTASDDVQRLAAVLARPGAARVAAARNAQAAPLGSGEAARQLGLFFDRIADLTAEERRELHDETFASGALAAVPRIAQQLARGHVSAEAARTSLDTLAPALERLEADRNPFAYVVRALCCALLARAGCARPT